MNSMDYIIRTLIKVETILIFIHYYSLLLFLGNELNLKIG